MKIQMPTFRRTQEIFRGGRRKRQIVLSLKRERARNIAAIGKTKN